MNPRRTALALAAMLVLPAVAGPPPAGDPPARRFGTAFVTDGEPRLPADRYADVAGEMPARIVLLVHGLDDPGWMWRDVIPALRAAGHVVARFEYPNDGPVADAADLLAANLADLRRLGVERVDVVAHSMGGLVTRDVLTRPAYYAGDGAGSDARPGIDRLVMCGTPNHGSNIARLRAVAEVKEQISRAFSGQGSWVGSLSDGSGEAAVDLLPGSDFLRRLNRRPLATHTAYTIIAGRMSPLAEEDVTAIGAKVRKAARAANAPRWLRDWIDTADTEASAVLNGAVRGLGDGCVTLDSARLAGVDDFVVVPANHVSMIVDVLSTADGAPPAIPVILDRLGSKEEGTIEAGMGGR